MFQSMQWWSRSLLASIKVWRPGCALGLALTGAAGMGPAGYADVVGVAPRIVVVETDSTPMRCASGVPFYVVNTLKAGQQLRVDGEEDGWLRVEYLTDMLAFAKAEDAALEPDGKSVRLVRPSRLAAVNDRGNERGHWWSLLETPLPADSLLPVHQIINAMNEVTTGYLVVAPFESRGYVKADSVRDATDEEALAFQGRTDVESPQHAAASSSGTGTPALASGDALNGNGAGAAKAASLNGVALDAGAASPTAGDDSIAVGVVGIAPPEIIHDINTLKARYEQVMALKGDEAREQIPVVIAELKRTAASLGSSSEDRRLRSAIDRGVALLQLRQEVLTTIKAYSQDGGRRVAQSGA